MPDELGTLRDLVKNYDRVATQHVEAKAARDQAIVAARRAGHSQRDVCEATGLGRESIRRIERAAGSYHRPD